MSLRRLFCQHPVLRHQDNASSCGVEAIFQAHIIEVLHVSVAKPQDALCSSVASRSNLTMTLLRQFMLVRTECMIEVLNEHSTRRHICWKFDQMTRCWVCCLNSPGMRG
jgi:hypothetical protein